VTDRLESFGDLEYFGGSSNAKQARAGRQQAVACSHRAVLTGSFGAREGLARARRDPPNRDPLTNPSPPSRGEPLSQKDRHVRRDPVGRNPLEFLKADSTMIIFKTARPGSDTLRSLG
jgi:hypothetical protein